MRIGMGTYLEEFEDAEVVGKTGFFRFCFIFFCLCGSLTLELECISIHLFKVFLGIWPIKKTIFFLRMTYCGQGPLSVHTYKGKKH